MWLNVSVRFRIVAPADSLAVIECVWQCFVFLCWWIALAVIECVWQCFVFLRWQIALAVLNVSDSVLYLFLCWQIATVWLNVTAFCIFVLTDSPSCDGMCVTVFCIFVLTDSPSCDGMCLRVFCIFVLTDNLSWGWMCLTVYCLFLRWQIAAVCDFYTYIRYIAQGLVKSAGKSQTVLVMKVQKLLRTPHPYPLLKIIFDKTTQVIMQIFSTDSVRESR